MVYAHNSRRYLPGSTSLELCGQHLTRIEPLDIKLWQDAVSMLHSLCSQFLQVLTRVKQPGAARSTSYPNQASQYQTIVRHHIDAPWSMLIILAGTYPSQTAQSCMISMLLDSSCLISNHRKMPYGLNFINAIAPYQD